MKKLALKQKQSICFLRTLKLTQTGLTSKNIIPITDTFKEQIIIIDQQVSGEDRMFQIEQHLTNGYVYQQDKVAEGYYLPTFGEDLILANKTSAGLELMKMRLTTKDNAAFPADNLSATEFLHQHNYKEFKTAKRMRLGTKKKWQKTNIYNRIGGNLG